MSLRYIQENGGGAVIYLAQEGRGIGLANKVAAYALQVRGREKGEMLRPTSRQMRSSLLMTQCQPYRYVNSRIPGLVPGIGVKVRIK